MLSSWMEQIRRSADQQTTTRDRNVPLRSKGHPCSWLIWHAEPFLYGYRLDLRGGPMGDANRLVFGLGLVVTDGNVAGEVERDKAEFRAGAFMLDRDDVLVFFGAGLELHLGRFVFGRGGVVMVILVAGEALGRVVRLADRVVVDTLDDVAVTAEGIAVKSLHFVGAVGGAVGDRFDAHLKAAEAHINVGGAVVVVSAMFLFDEFGSGVGGQADRGLGGGVIGLDLQATEGRGDFYVVVAVFVVVGDAATGDGEGEKELQQDAGVARRMHRFGVSFEAFA